MKTILVLGNLPLATKVMKHVLRHPKAKLVGVVVPEEEKEYPSNDGEVCAYAFAKRKRIPIYKVEDLREKEGFDLAISARNNEILPFWFLGKFNLGVVNCHGGYLPDYKGVGGHVFPIVNGEEYSGGTIHWMTERVDEGDLIDRLPVDIRPSDTGYSLFIKINDAIYFLIVKCFEEILTGTAPRIPQHRLKPSTQTGVSYFYFKKDFKELTKKRYLSERERRALYWPGAPIRGGEG